MQMNLKQALFDNFGYADFRTGQEQVISDVMQGQNVMAIFPTGAGKSMCYQLPAVILPHVTLVISPLLALIQDQIDFLNQNNVPAASINSTQSKEETQDIIAKVRTGQIKVLMVSVEKLKNERFRDFISQIRISLLVVDEAHCISEWGHNFRPDYLKLPTYRALLGDPPILLLTATATGEVIQDMQKKFSVQSQHVHKTGFYRSNLYLQVLPCSEEEKTQKLLECLAQQPNACHIIYVTLQRTAEGVAEFLAQNGIQATAYHAGMSDDRRRQIQNEFMAGKRNCIVATIAFGMGVDKSDIRHVIHYNIPKSLEAYAQEIGRAGRDGKPATCTILANKQTVNTLENFVYGATPDTSNIVALIQAIDKEKSLSDEWHIMPLRISQRFNIPLLSLKTLLVYLELKGMLETKYTYWATYKFKALQPAEAIFNKFTDEKRQFIELIFDTSSKARTWYSLDFDAIFYASGNTRERVFAALGFLEEKGLIEVKSSEQTDVYKVNSIDLEQVCNEVSTLFEKKESFDLKRTHEVISLLESQTCLSAKLASYFKDDNAPQNCGHCSVCAGKVAQLPQTNLFPLNPEALKPCLERLEKRVLEKEMHEVLPLSDKTKARFLCGIKAPLFTQLKANKLSGFGCCELYPLSEVLKAISTL